MTLTLQAAGFSNPHDGPQARASDIASTYVPMMVNREFLRGGTLRDLRATVDIALRPEWQLRLEEQTEWWRFPLLSAAPQQDAGFTLQLSYRPIGRTRQ